MHVLLFFYTKRVKKNKKVSFHLRGLIVCYTVASEKNGIILHFPLSINILGYSLIRRYFHCVRTLSFRISIGLWGLCTPDWIEIHLHVQLTYTMPAGIIFFTKDLITFIVNKISWDSMKRTGSVNYS